MRLSAHHLKAELKNTTKDQYIIRQKINHGFQSLWE